MADDNEIEIHIQTIDDFVVAANEMGQSSAIAEAVDDPNKRILIQVYMLDGSVIDYNNIEFSLKHYVLPVGYADDTHEAVFEITAEYALQIWDRSGSRDEALERSMRSMRSKQPVPPPEGIARDFVIAGTIEFEETHEFEVNDDGQPDPAEVAAFRLDLMQQWSQDNFTYSLNARAKEIKTNMLPDRLIDIPPRFADTDLNQVIPREPQPLSRTVSKIVVSVAGTGGLTKAARPSARAVFDALKRSNGNHRAAARLLMGLKK